MKYDSLNLNSQRGRHFLKGGDPGDGTSNFKRPGILVDF